MNQYIGAYQIVDLIGTGGMGEVYRAIDNKIGRVVALKVLNKTTYNPQTAKRFINEARIQAGLQHPNIATLYGFFDNHGRPCMVMECVDGQTLEERIQRQGYLTQIETRHIFMQIADTVRYIHEKGIVHRDIKPNNIKVASTGDVKLLDFGIAREVISDRLTRVGNYVGTPQYLAPERLKSGTGGDSRSDIWSLGILLYEMITGSLPFETDSIPNPITITSLRVTGHYPLLSKDMSRIISKCLAIKPGQRYQSVSELLQAFTACSLESMGSCSTKNEDSPESGESALLQPWLWGITGTILISLLVIGLLLYHPWVETKLSKTFQQPYPGNTHRPAAAITQLQLDKHVLLQIETSQDLSTPTEVFIDGVSFGSTPIKEFEPIGREFELMLKRNCHKILTKTIRISPTNNQYKYTLQRDQDQCHF